MRALPIVLATCLSLAALAIVVAAVQAQPSPVALPSAQPGFIQTSGASHVLAVPDVVYLTLGVQATGATAQDAANNASTAVAATLAGIKGQGITDKDIQTTQIALSPVFADKQPNQITGYHASQSLSVTVDDLTIVSRVFDAAVQAGSNSNLSIRFSIKDPSALQQQALVSAVQQATGKATSMAGAAGLKLTGAYNLSESNVQVVEREALASSAADAAPAAPSVPVQAGQLVVSANVQASFSYSR
jgi:uncharacterized protein YggE